MTPSAIWQGLPLLRSLDPMSRALHRLGRFAVRRRGIVLLGWLIAAALLWTGVTAADGGYSDDFRIPGVESQQALDVLMERFPEAAGGSAQVVVHAPEGDLDEPARAGAVTDLVERLGHLPHVETVLDPADTGLVSADRTTAMARVQYTEEPRELGMDTYHELEAAIEPTRGAGLQVELGGDLGEEEVGARLVRPGLERAVEGDGGQVRGHGVSRTQRRRRPAVAQGPPIHHTVT